MGHASSSRRRVCSSALLSGSPSTSLDRTWGLDGQVVVQQWPAHTTAPNVRSADRRLDLLFHGATPLGGAHVLRRHTCVAPDTPALLHTPEPPCGSLGDAGRTGCSETSSVSVPRELCQPCEAPLRRHGPSVGGPCWPCRCNKPSRALPSGQLGRRPTTRGDSRPQSWNACLTLLTQQGRAACRYAAHRIP